MQIPRNEKGFTLIELVVVIVILGILAATALPKFLDMSADAGNAAAKGVGGAISSGSAINFAKKKAGGTATSLSDASVCTDVSRLSSLVSGVTLTSATPTSDTMFKVSGTGSCASSAESASCSVAGKSGSAQTYTLICAS